MDVDVEVTGQEANRMAHIIATNPHYGTKGWSVVAVLARRAFDSLPAGYAQHTEETCRVCDWKRR